MLPITNGIFKIEESRRISSLSREVTYNLAAFSKHIVDQRLLSSPAALQPIQTDQSGWLRQEAHPHSRSRSKTIADYLLSSILGVSSSFTHNRSKNGIFVGRFGVDSFFFFPSLRARARAGREGEDRSASDARWQIGRGISFHLG